MNGDDIPLLDYGVAHRALGGAQESGDLSAVIATPYGLLLAVSDGLGHGYNAALASRIAVAALETNSARPLEWLLAHCHEALTGTRGVAMCLAALRADDAAMTWTSIGNVEGLRLRAGPAGAQEREHVMMRSGVIGHRMPTLRTMTLSLLPGDLLIFATDGVREGFERLVKFRGPPQGIADDILAQYGKASDDALVLVGRWHGRGEGGR